MTPEDLHDPSRFALVWELDHRSIARALQPYIWRRSGVGIGYAVANVAALALVVAVWLRAGIPFLEGFPTLCLGICVGYVALVPVHEGVHALAYRWLGARDVRVRYRWRNLTAYCVADRFVVSKRGLIGVALAPFAVLNPLLAVAAWWVPGGWGLALAGALLLHVGACSGDFGIVNWLRINGDSDVYSYDDVSGERSYFFHKRIASPSGDQSPDR